MYEPLPNTGMQLFWVRSPPPKLYFSKKTQIYYFIITMVYLLCLVTLLQKPLTNHAIMKNSTILGNSSFLKYMELWEILKGVLKTSGHIQSKCSVMVSAVWVVVADDSAQIYDVNNIKLTSVTDTRSHMKLRQLCY